MVAERHSHGGDREVGQGRGEVGRALCFCSWQTNADQSTNKFACLLKLRLRCAFQQSLLTPSKWPLSLATRIKQGLCRGTKEVVVMVVMEDVMEEEEVVDKVTKMAAD